MSRFLIWPAVSGVALCLLWTFTGDLGALPIVLVAATWLSASGWVFGELDREDSPLEIDPEGLMPLPVRLLIACAAPIPALFAVLAIVSIAPPGYER
jgi:hypothetical protein